MKVGKGRVYANFQFDANPSRTSLKTELLTNVEAMIYAEAWIFLSQNYLLEKDRYRLILSETLERAGHFYKKLREMNIKTFKLFQ